MNFKDVSALTIDGNHFQKEGLISLSQIQIENSANAQWRKSILDFLLHWLDKKDHIIVKTSGSTGTPKSIKIKKQQMLNSALKTGRFLDLKKNDSALLCLSADFIAGKMMIVRAMVLGLDLKIIEPSGNPMKNIDEYFDFAAMVPMQVYKVFEDKEGIKKLNRIKNLIIGGGPVPEALKQKFKSLTNQSFSTYGMTETISHIAMEKLNGTEADGFLHLMPGIKIETDSQKKLIIHASDICDEIVNTNDLAEIREDGSFRILGRFDNMIISGGINIIPEIIENKIEKLIDNRFIISSVPDDKLGEQSVLVIEDIQWPPAKIATIMHKLIAALDAFEQPRLFEFMPKFPETPNQKIDRLAIKNLIRKRKNAQALWKQVTR